MKNTQDKPLTGPDGLMRADGERWIADIGDNARITLEHPKDYKIYLEKNGDRVLIFSSPKEDVARQYARRLINGEKH